MVVVLAGGTGGAQLAAGLYDHLRHGAPESWAERERISAPGMSGHIARLEAASVLLDAGDLAGAVREAGTLSGPPAEKLTSWVADAKALLAAREALASLVMG